MSFLITTLPEYQQLQIRLWAALDNPERKYLEDFAQELFDKIIHQEDMHLEEISEITGYCGEVEYENECFEEEIDDLEQQKEKLLDKIESQKEHVRSLEKQIDELADENETFLYNYNTDIIL